VAGGQGSECQQRQATDGELVLLQQQRQLRKASPLEPETPDEVERIIKQLQLPHVGPLWDHLVGYVIPSRAPLGDIGNLEVLSSLEHKMSMNDTATLQNAFAQAVVASGISLVSPLQEPKTRVVLAPACGLQEVVFQDWQDLSPGAVLIVPVCSASDLAWAPALMKQINCRLLMQSCGLETEQCRKLPARDLKTLAFIRGYMVLEKAGAQASPADESALPGFSTAEHSTPERLDTFGMSMMDRYLQGKDISNSSVMVVGDVCNAWEHQKEAPDVASFWRSVFPNASYEFVETKQSCRSTALQAAARLNMSVRLVGRYSGGIEAVAGKAATQNVELVVDSLESLPDGKSSSSALAATVQNVWPRMQYSAIYLVEDAAAGLAPTCEVSELTSAPARLPRRSAAGYVLELAMALVVRRGRVKIQRIECQENSCLLQKVQEPAGSADEAFWSIDHLMDIGEGMMELFEDALKAG